MRKILRVFAMLLLVSCDSDSLLTYHLDRAGITVSLPSDLTVESQVIDLSNTSFYSTLRATKEDEFNYYITVTYYPESEIEVDLADVVGSSFGGPKGGCGNFEFLSKESSYVFGDKALKIICKVSEVELSMTYSFIRGRQHVMLVVISNVGEISRHMEDLVSAIQLIPIKNK